MKANEGLSETTGETHKLLVSQWDLLGKRNLDLVCYSLFFWLREGLSVLFSRSLVLLLPSFSVSSDLQEHGAVIQLSDAHTGSQPCGYTTYDTQTSVDERCCPLLWLVVSLDTWRPFARPDVHAPAPTMTIKPTDVSL